MPHERRPPDDPREWIIRTRGNLVRALAVLPGVYLQVKNLCFDAQQAAKLIVRYDIPDDSGILIEESLRPGHFDIFATFDQLHPYLTPDFKEEVVKEG
jgi:hypothetical protein